MRVSAALSSLSPLGENVRVKVEILHCARSALVQNDKKIVYARIFSFVILSVAKDLIFNARQRYLNSAFRIPNSELIFYHPEQCEGSQH